MAQCVINPAVQQFWVTFLFLGTVLCVPARASIWKACEQAVVRAIWGEHQLEAIEPVTHPLLPALSISGGEVPAIPETDREEGESPDHYTWRIPSSPSQALPIMREVIAHTLNHVYADSVGQPWVDITQIDSTNHQLEAIWKSARAKIEDACVSPANTVPTVIEIPAFGGELTNLQFVLRRQARPGPLEVTVRHAQHPLSAVEDDLTHFVVKSNPLPEPREYKFQAVTNEKRNQGVAYIAKTLKTFSEISKAQNPERLLVQVDDNLQDQIKRDVYRVYLQAAKDSLAADYTRNHLYNIAADAIDRIDDEPYPVLNSFEDLRTLIRLQAGYAAHKEAVIKLLDKQIRQLERMGTLMTYLELDMEMGEYDLNLSIPMRVVYMIGEDQVVIGSSQTTDRMPERGEHRTEFRYMLRATNVVGAIEFREMEERVKYWLEHAAQK
jgi:hypothetical protein